MSNDVSTEAASPEHGRPPSGCQLTAAETTCGICYDVLNDAHQAPCCGQLACRDCLDDVTATSETCPFCRATLVPGQAVPDRRADRQAAALERPCANEGCAVTGKRAELKAHRAECRHNHDELRQKLQSKHALLQAALLPALRSVFQGELPDPNPPKVVGGYHSASSYGYGTYGRSSTAVTKIVAQKPVSLAFSAMGMHCHIFANPFDLFEGSRISDSLPNVEEADAAFGLPLTHLRLDTEHHTVRFMLQRKSEDSENDKEWQRVVIVLLHPTDLSRCRVRRAAIPPKQHVSMTFANWVSKDDLVGFIQNNRLVVAIGTPSASDYFEL